MCVRGELCCEGCLGVVHKTVRLFGRVTGCSECFNSVCNGELRWVECD